MEIPVYGTLIKTLKYPICTLTLVGSLCVTASPATAQEVLHPTKISGHDPGRQATPDIHTNQSFNWRIMGHSADKNFRAGMSWTKKGVTDVDEPDTVDEFLVILKGREKYTSLDGTVIEVGAGDAIFVPKGWRGKWESNGPVEYFFSVYDPDKLYEERSRQ
jgi:uncharacterized cupin superfamily protein